MSGIEQGLLWERLGVDEEGQQMHPRPPGHGFRAEQDALGQYALPGWKHKRGLPHYITFERADGKSRTGEEFKCNSGQTETEWDAANVPGLTLGGGKGKKAKAAAQEQRSEKWSAALTGSSTVTTCCCGGRARAMSSPCSSRG
jgi:hypothetical protein